MALTSNWFDQIYGPLIEWEQQRMADFIAMGMPEAPSVDYWVPGRLDTLHSGLDETEELLQRLDAKLLPVCVHDDAPVSPDSLNSVPQPRMSDMARVIDDAAAKVANNNRRIRELLDALTI